MCTLAAKVSKVLPPGTEDDPISESEYDATTEAAVPVSPQQGDPPAASGSTAARPAAGAKGGRRKSKGGQLESSDNEESPDKADWQPAPVGSPDPREGASLAEGPSSEG